MFTKWLQLQVSFKKLSSQSLAASVPKMITVKAPLRFHFKNWRPGAFNCQPRWQLSLICQPGDNCLIVNPGAPHLTSHPGAPEPECWPGQEPGHHKGHKRSWTQIHKYKNTKILKYTNTRTHKYKYKSQDIIKDANTFKSYNWYKFRWSCPIRDEQRSTSRSKDFVQRAGHSKKTSFKKENFVISNYIYIVNLLVMTTTSWTWWFQN